MPTVLRIGLENAGAAAALALIVAGLGFAFRRRPAVTHALWVLVLVKLVTPPVVNWSVPGFATEATASATAEAAHATTHDLDAVLASVSRLEDLDVFLGKEVSGGDVVEFTATPSVTAKAVPNPAPKPSATARLWGRIGLVAALVWALGSVLTLAVSATRVVRFRRALALAKPASDGVCELVDRVADRLDLGRRPRVLTVPGEVSPMVWTFGRSPALILPSELWARLDGTQRETLVAHELAHLKRGDDRVRWLEQVVTVLYWWLPVVWWARRALRTAEEQCCDAWVVWAIPGAARAYAETLVETVDFLNGARTATPAAASGFGQAYQLKRRLIMIMRGTARKSLGWGGGLFAFAASVTMLPFNPTLAQKPAPEAEPKVEVVVTSGDRAASSTIGGDVFSTGAVVFTTAPDRSEDEHSDQVDPKDVLKETVDRLKKKADELKSAGDGRNAEAIQAIQKTTEELEKTLVKQKKALHEKLQMKRLVEETAEKAAERDKAAAKLRSELKELSDVVKKRSDEMREAGNRLREAQQRLAEASRKLATTEGLRAVTANRLFRVDVSPKKGEILEFHQNFTPDKFKAVREFTPGTPPRPFGGADQERRLSEVEKKLDKVIEKLEGLNKGPSSEKDQPEKY